MYDESDNKKEVDFKKYCATCQYENTPAEEEPCCDCLEHPARQYSHKPEKYIEKIFKTSRVYKDERNGR